MVGRGGSGRNILTSNIQAGDGGDTALYLDNKLVVVAGGGKGFNFTTETGNGGIPILKQKRVGCAEIQAILATQGQGGSNTTLGYFPSTASASMGDSVTIGVSGNGADGFAQIEYVKHGG